MLAVQVLINALVLGCLYACIAIGFSLVWGVLNVINLIHGSFIVLGAYLAWGAYQWLGISPWYTLVIAAPLFFAFGYLLQQLLLNRVISAPVLVTLTLTFGLSATDWQARTYPSARSWSSSTSLWAISTSPLMSRQAQAPQTPSRQE